MSFLDRYRLAALIQAVEDDLRTSIREYVAPFVEAENAFSEKYPELIRRASIDGLAHAGVESLVDYLDFGDAFTLLNRHRGMLPTGLADSVRALTPAFEMAVPIRNRIMHGRPLRAGDEEQVAKLGQSVAAVSGFPLTCAVVAHLLDDPIWSPLIDISTRSYGTVLHNLPLPEFDETGLLGRDDELRQIKELLLRRRYPVITIAGEGGIGKTALAVQTLYDLVDESDSPFDVVLWASLKTERLTGRGVEQIRDAAADLLSVTGELTSAFAEDTEGNLQVLVDALDGLNSIVAIDNVESIDPNEVRLLIDALPGAQFLLTSRVGLGEIERRITLGALEPPAAKIMVRQLARRRGLVQIAQLNDRQAEKVSGQLRGSPLAIRWFVEAVHVGAQPDDLLRDQSTVLQFCMSTIYDSLSAEGHKLVECLLALDTSATIGQLALLTELDRDEVQNEVYELQRRAIVEVESRLSETLTQSYALSAMARAYLRQFGSLDPSFADDIRRQLREIAATDEVMRQFDNRVALEPMAMSVETAEERAVANLLRQALRKSRRRDIEGARADVARARDAVPGFFETFRVGAFIESDARPEEARRLYAEAYRLAPDELSKAKVAYWLATHLLNVLSPREAEDYARQAHTTLDLPATALLLGRICMYEGQRFDDAEDLLARAAAADHAKTRLIAEAVLLDLAKRRIEQLAEVEKKPAAALETAVAAIARAEKLFSAGVVDQRFDQRFAELVSESVLVALRLPDPGVVAELLGEVLEAIDRNFRVLARRGLREEWTWRLARLCSQDDCPEELVVYAQKLESRLQSKLLLAKSGRAAGEVLEYSGQKHYGFIQPLEGGDNVFFHKSAIVEPRDALLLTRGAEVRYAPREELRDGIARLRAEEVTLALTEAERDRAMKGRRGRVVHKSEAFLFTEDTATQERIYMRRFSFRDPGDWRRLRDGDIVRFDVEFNAQGPKAVDRSASIERDSP